MKNTDLYLLITARSISLLGSLMVFYAVPLIIYTLYQSGAILAIFELASLVPSILLGVPIGMYLKKKNVKRMWVLTSGLLGSYSLFVFFFMNPITLFLLNVFSSILFIIIGIAGQTLMQIIVDKDELVWANSLRALSMGVVGASVPVISGFILSWNSRAVFLIDSLTFLVEIMLILKIKKDAPSIVSGKEKIREIFMETIKYMTSNRMVFNSTLLIFLLILLGGGLKILNIAFFTQLFPNPYEFFGMAYTISQVGFLSVLIPTTLKILKFRNPYKALVIAIVPYAIYLFVMGIFRNPLFILASFFLLGLGNGISSPNSSAVFQTYVDKEHIRQVSGVVGTLVDAAKISSVVIMGILVDVFPVWKIFVMLAILMSVIFVIFYAIAPLKNPQQIHSHKE